MMRGGAIRTLLWLLVATLGEGIALAQPATTGAPPPVRDKFYTRRSEFDVPFSVDTRAADLVEVQLMVSVDQGAHWDLAARGSPQDRALRFRAPRDGEYWLTTRTLDRTGRARPDGVLEPQLCAVIDTSPPQIAFQAVVGPAGNIQARWEVQDERLAPHTFRIVVQSGMVGGFLGAEQLIPVEPLKPTEVPGRYQGSVSFWPDVRAVTLQVRAEVLDAAGNSAVAAKPIDLPLRGARRPPRPAWAGGAMNAGYAPNAGGTPATPVGTGAAPAAMAGAAGLPPAGGAYAPPPVPGAPALPGAPSNSSGAAFPQPPGYPARPGTAATAGFPTSPGFPTVPPTGGPGRMVSSSNNAPPTETHSPPTPTLTGDLPGGERPRMTSSKKFSLDYDIESAGPGGVADVELWVTRDRGATWTKWGTDADKTSPFDIEVDSEGIYGFRIVIISRSGIASSSPRSGDPADLWVGVDMTSPKVQLTSVSFGEGEHAGELDIRWEAEDDRFGLRPITLQYGESAAGPWQTIASGLTNNGQYYWRMSGQVPPKALLRIEARDEADNIGHFQMAEPINLAGLNPAGRIRNFQINPK